MKQRTVSVMHCVSTSLHYTHRSRWTMRMVDETNEFVTCDDERWTMRTSSREENGKDTIGKTKQTNIWSYVSYRLYTRCGSDKRWRSISGDISITSYDHHDKIGSERGHIRWLCVHYNMYIQCRHACWTLYMSTSLSITHLLFVSITMVHIRVIPWLHHHGIHICKSVFTLIVPRIPIQCDGGTVVASGIAFILTSHWLMLGTYMIDHNRRW